MENFRNQIRCVVINVDGAEDRWEAMKAKASAASIRIERLSAINASAPENEEIISRFTGLLYNGEPLNPFQVSCFLSHRLSWQNLLASEDHWLAVFEDDAHFGNDAASFLNDQWIPDGVSLIRLETTAHRTRVSIDPVTIHAGRGLHVVSGAHMGAAGYMISRECAHRLLDLSETITAPVDCFLFDPKEVLMQKMRVHQLVPAPVIQEGVLAYIESRELKPVAGAVASRMTAGKHRSPGALIRKWARLSRRHLLAIQYRLRLYPPGSDRMGPEIPITFM